MAFMVPVMKKDFDIYKTGRSRRASECSKSSACSSRKVSECRSECPSLSTSPESLYAVSPSHRSQPIQSMNRNTSRPQISRASSRNSQSSLISSPAKANGNCNVPKPSTNDSQSSLNKFHSRLVDKLRKSLRKARSTDRS